jgi:predicted anti-sigma-YlaC factor YlaD
MECREFRLQLDEYLDGRADERPIRAHLAACAECRNLHQHAVAVQKGLRKLSPPEMHPSFVDRAIARAVRPDDARAHPTRRAVLGMALAASLVLGVAVGAFFSLRDSPVQTVTLALERAETVRMVFNSAKPLQAATLSLVLPDNVEVVGYGSQRELVWQTDLREGQNLLQLPLIARGPVKDELLARLSHGASTKTFRLKVESGGAGVSGM